MTMTGVDLVDQGRQVVQQNVEKLCYGSVAKVPLRWEMSATQVQICECSDNA